ncbi:FecR family protein [Chitinophaga polysaccharea]|uniref:FecR family protein n=1 Tax=Chitinophaga polysaccharea TaxID=1293035 RepID=A0A561PLJ1_9BACT|nr:FecR family protein [Chitinophaga polysaccharea]TWF38975.1 FecR family protein [Chitinophaga polysaccharea]
MQLSDWHQKYLLSILKKYEAGQASPAEVRFIESYMDSLDNLDNGADNMEDSSGLQKDIKAELLKSIRQPGGKRTEIPFTKTRQLPYRRRMRVWAAAAAIALLLAGAGMYWWLQHAAGAGSPALAARADIAPGGNGAVLHLSDGSTLVLDSAGNGTVAVQGKVKVVKENGMIKYQGTTSEEVYNEVTTDKGRQWRMVLPDGSGVWLNAASSIRYPLSFNGKERIVDITGEVYFEVVHNEKQPFKVRVGKHVIEDIGTAFNINAYANEPVMKTTLVEGLIRVNGTLMKPGEQAQVAVGQEQVTVSKVDNPADAMAWVNGQLSLESNNLQALLRKIARWYNIDIKIEGTLPETGFIGMIDRNVYLSDVIKALTVYGVNARLENRTLIVSAK